MHVYVSVIPIMFEVKSLNKYTPSRYTDLHILCLDSYEIAVERNTYSMLRDILQ